MLNLPPILAGQTVYVQAFELTPKPQVSPVETIEIPFGRRFDFGTKSSPLETG